MEMRMEIEAAAREYACEYIGAHAAIVVLGGGASGWGHACFDWASEAIAEYEDNEEAIYLLLA